MRSSSSVRGSILVTGASSGIGEATVGLLQQAGFSVFAGYRKVEDGKRLRAQFGDAVHPLALDLTSPELIDRAADEIRQSAGGQLAGLVHNAGLFFMLPLELTPMPDVRELFEVNVFGMVALTRALLPMLRVGQGRIIVVGSGAGRAAAPGSGIYSASKHAQEALVAVMRMEFAGFGVGATLVAPGAIQTPIWAKSAATAQRIAASLKPEQLQLYGALLDRIMQMNASTGESGIPPSRVANVILAALTDKHMQTRYSVGIESHAIDFLRLLPAILRESLLRRHFKL